MLHCLSVLDRPRGSYARSIDVDCWRSVDFILRVMTQLVLVLSLSHFFARVGMSSELKEAASWILHSAGSAADASS